MYNVHLLINQVRGSVAILYRNWRVVEYVIELSTHYFRIFSLLKS